MIWHAKAQLIWALIIVDLISTPPSSLACIISLKVPYIAFCKKMKTLFGPRLSSLSFTYYAPHASRCRWCELRPELFYQSQTDSELLLRVLVAFLLSHARSFHVHTQSYYVYTFSLVMSRKSKRQLALTHNCRHVVEFSAEPGNLKTIIQMISLLLAAKSLLWLAMIFPTLEFLISRCEHQFDVHQSPSPG